MPFLYKREHSHLALSLGMSDTKPTLSLPDTLVGANFTEIVENFYQQNFNGL